MKPEYKHLTGWNCYCSQFQDSVSLQSAFLAVQKKGGRNDWNKVEETIRNSPFGTQNCLRELEGRC